jgi:hypothetical protein
MANVDDVTLRRTIQQIGHCVEEALAVVENDEPVQCAIDDLEQAMMLIQDVALQELRRRR